MRSRPLLPALLIIVAISGCGGSGDGSDTTTPTTGATTSTTTAPAATWDKVAPPAIDGSTDEVRVDKGALADGRYWAVLSRVSGSGELVFTVSRAYFGAACEQWASERGMTEGCANDYAVDDADSAIVALDGDATVSVTSASGPGQNYSVTVGVLDGLVAGTATSPVEGYEWAGFPFVVTVADGAVARAEQYWVP